MWAVLEAQDAGIRADVDTAAWAWQDLHVERTLEVL
jgi:hypothetical protein